MEFSPPTASAQCKYPMQVPSCKNENEEELDLVSGHEASSDDCRDGQWAHLLGKWEDDKARTMEELALPEKACCLVNDQNSTWDDDEAMKEDQLEDSDNEAHENLIRESLEVLQRHRAQASVEPKKNTKKRRHNAKFAELDKHVELTKVNVDDLRYSQRGCSECFTCGRSVWQLVRDLERGNVRLSAPFLRLTVFETRDERTEQTVLRCIDNRRLYAFKEYARRCPKYPLMVNVNLFSYNTLMQTQRFIHNSDDTDGFSVHLRKRRKGSGS